MEQVYDRADVSELEREVSLNSEDKRSTFEKLTDFYFKPKSFEKNGKLYEALGVNWFRKYCPNGGSWFSKKTGYSFVSGRKKSDLKSFTNLTKALEGVHAFAFFPLYTYQMIDNLSQENYGAAAWNLATNILINLYPIMSNRYNRNKANKMIDILEKRENK